jgi:hypothetical protein
VQALGALPSINKVPELLQREQQRAKTAGWGSRPNVQAKGLMPSWRRTKAQRVDEKVEQLFENWRLVD